MNRQQLNHLRSRVAAASLYAKKMLDAPSSFSYLTDEELTDAPAAVRKARADSIRLKKVVDDWIEKQRMAVEFKRKEIDKVAEKVEALILFDDPKLALKAVEDFERKHGPK